MLTLDSQRSQFNVVLSDLTRCKSSIQEICDKLSSLGFMYFGCVHDKDVKENGEKKLTHCHIVLLSMKRLRVKQVINYFVDIAKTNFENVQVDEVVSTSSCIQYLIHLNDSNKYQYSREELFSNNPSQADAYLIETPKSNELTTQALFDFIFKDKLSRIELCYAIGIGKYQHYKSTIEDLYKFRESRPN